MCMLLALICWVRLFIFLVMKHFLYFEEPDTPSKAYYSNSHFILTVVKLVPSSASSKTPMTITINYYLKIFDL